MINESPNRASSSSRLSRRCVRQLRKQRDRLCRRANARPEHSFELLTAPARNKGPFVARDEYVAPVLSMECKNHRIPVLSTLTVAQALSGISWRERPIRDNTQYVFERVANHGTTVFASVQHIGASLPEAIRPDSVSPNSVRPHRLLRQDGDRFEMNAKTGSLHFISRYRQRRQLSADLGRLCVKAGVVNAIRVEG
jgi:hypothetical protein